MKYFLMILILINCVGAVNATFAEDRKFAAINGRYLSLRNTDIKIKRIEEWKNVAADLSEYGRKNKSSADGSRSLFHGGLAFLTVFRVSAQLVDLKAAKECFSMLASRNDELSDDALIELSTIARDLENDEPRAILYEQFVREHFPKSDSALRLAAHKTVPQTAVLGTAKIASGPVIMLDPGHGGEDFGAIGVGGLLEKDLTLAIALAVEKIAREAGYPRIILTRRSDVFVPLRERMNKANENKAAAFLSIHANSTPEKKGFGIEVFYLNSGETEASEDKAARELAGRENDSVRFEGPEGDLAYMLGDLVQSGKMPESRALASRLLDSLVQRLRSSWPDVRRLAVRTAPFYVLVGAHMPCVLAEIGFIDHPVEGARLAEKVYREEIARGIYEALTNLQEVSTR